MHFWLLAAFWSLLIWKLKVLLEIGGYSDSLRCSWLYRLSCIKLRDPWDGCKSSLNLQPSTCRTPTFAFPHHLFLLQKSRTCRFLSAHLIRKQCQGQGFLIALHLVEGCACPYGSVHSKPWPSFAWHSEPYLVQSKRSCNPVASIVRQSIPGGKFATFSSACAWISAYLKRRQWRSMLWSSSLPIRTLVFTDSRLCGLWVP